MKIKSTGSLTWWTVVADGEVRRNIASDVGKTVWTVLCGAADGGGALPDNLGEVTPVLKIGHIWICLAVETVEVVDLAVVEEIGDDGRDIGGLDTSSNVLTVATAVDVHAVGVDAGGSDGGRSAGKAVIPGQVGCRVVGTVVVVVVDDSLVISGGQGDSCAGGSG